MEKTGYRQHLGAAAIAILCVVGLTLLSSKAPVDPNVHIETRFLMDTMVVISVAHEDPQAAKVAADLAFGEMERVDRLMARVEGTPLWELNIAGGGVADPEIIKVLEAGLKAARETGGAFDPTLAAVIDLWKIKEGPHAPPTQKDIDHARASTGWQKIRMDGDGKVRLGGTDLDLGGIGKGYAVDLAVESLKASGLENFLVNAGGDLFIAGSKNGKPWKVGVQHPRSAEEVFGAVPKAGALVTSGDYERYFDWEGVRYHHVFSPATGRPATSGCVSVTVWADTTMRADILATAAFVLGPEKGLKLLETQKDVEGMIIDESLTEHVTTGFEETVTAGVAR
jgi:thiamine biosynthesis lipoprotein